MRRGAAEALWCMGARRSPCADRPSSCKPNTRSQRALVDIGDQEVDVREALRFHHGAPRGRYCSLGRYSLKPCLPVIFT